MNDETDNIPQRSSLTPEQLGMRELQEFTYYEQDAKRARKAALPPGPSADEATDANSDDDTVGDEAADAPHTDLQAAPLLGFHDATEPEHPTILVLHASVGSGHRSAAAGVAQALEVLRDTGEVTPGMSGPLPPDTRVVVLDVLQWGEHVFDGNKTASGFTGPTRPFYDVTWRYTLTGRLLWGQGTFLNYLLWRKFTRYIAHVKPLAVVATHIMGANLAAGARTICKLDFPLICVPTDYETEGLWPHAATDMFCVGTEAMAETLRARRVGDERISITGIPASLSFDLTWQKDEARALFDLPQDKQVLLMLAGAKLPQPYVNMRRIIDEALPALAGNSKLHVAIVCGTDAEYAASLRARVADSKFKNVSVIEYTTNMAALMAAADLVVCKPGGLTVTECLCARAPMILLGRAYGQEKVNVKMLTAEGAAMHASTARELVSMVRSIQAHPERIDAMMANANLLRRPRAASDVAHIAARLALEPAEERAKRATDHSWWFTFSWGDRPAHAR